MIYDLVKETRDDVKGIQKDLKEGAVTMENHTVRLKGIEGKVECLEDGQKKIKGALFEHVSDKKKHYNQGYSETFVEKAWRRKDVIALATAIATGIGWLINNYFGG